MCGGSFQALRDVEHRGDSGRCYRAPLPPSHIRETIAPPGTPLPRAQCGKCMCAPSRVFSARINPNEGERRVDCSTDTVLLMRLGLRLNFVISEGELITVVEAQSRVFVVCFLILSLLVGVLLISFWCIRRSSLLKAKQNCSFLVRNQCPACSGTFRRRASAKAIPKAAPKAASAPAFLPPLQSNVDAADPLVAGRPL